MSRSKRKDKVPAKDIAWIIVVTEHLIQNNEPKLSDCERDALFVMMLNEVHPITAADQIIEARMIAREP